MTATEMTLVGPVRLELPPIGGMSRVARLAASGLASLAGFTLDEIDDIKIAVSEVMIALVEHGAASTLELEFRLSDSDFTVVGSTYIPDFDPDHPDLWLCRTVLESVCDGHRIAVDRGTATISASVSRVS